MTSDRRVDRCQGRRSRSSSFLLFFSVGRAERINERHRAFIRDSGRVVGTFFSRGLEGGGRYPAAAF